MYGGHLDVTSIVKWTDQCIANKSAIEAYFAKSYILPNYQIVKWNLILFHNVLSLKIAVNLFNL